MPSLESTPLLDLFDQIDSTKDEKTKSLALAKAKFYILNEMTPQMIKETFAKEEQNFESLFGLNIWKNSLQDSSLTYTEPYDIIVKIFSSFKSLVELVDEFKEQILFLINQKKDEQAKHICIENMIRLTKSLEINEFEKHEDPCAKMTGLVTDLKKILIDLVKQIPVLTASYSELLGQLFCHLTTRLSRIEGSLIEKHQDITPVFSSTVFDDNPELNGEFERVSKINMIMRVRVMEIALSMAAISRDHLYSICEQNFNLDQNLRELLHAKDVLTKLGVIELLSEFCVTFHGYEFLKNHGHLQGLLNDLVKLDSTEITSSFAETSIIKLFSLIAKVMPEKVQESFPEYFNIIFWSICLKDFIKNNIEINIAVQTFTYLLNSNIVKKFLFEQYKEKFHAMCQSLVYIVRYVIDDKIKSDSLACIARIIALDPELLSQEHCDEKWLASPWILSMEELTKTFFESLVSAYSPVEFFRLCLDLSKEPFLDYRLSAQLIFRALAQSRWGLKLLFTENNLIKKDVFINEYLLNRSIETEKEGMESKFELIKMICANFKLNYDLFPLIGEGNLEALEEYIRLGAYYAPSGQKVAFQST